MRKNLKAVRHWVYIVRAADRSYYTGYTNNLSARLAVHNHGRGAKYLRGRLPVKLVYSRWFRSLGRALREECRIKSLTRQQKQCLIRGSNP